MAVNINVLSQWDNKGIRAAQDDLDKLKSKTQATSQKLAQGASLVSGGILAGAGAIGVGLFQVGTQFDDAFDRIRIGTGLTGPALEALQNDMKAVAGSVPATFSDASTAVTEFSKRLGLTGQPLQDLSKQVLELSRMTDTDLKTNIDAVGKVMENFSVAAGDQSGKLDLLFRASQKSGVSVADLASQMSDAGVVLRDVGFGFDHSAALLATLGKAGVDVGDVIPALSRAMGTAAKQGKDASQVFEETFNKIANAKDPIEGAAEAVRVFGQKAGPKLAALIQEGKLSYLDMVDAITNGGDGIMAASADTQDFAEKLTTLKNRVFLAIEPIATRVFNAIGDAVEKLAPKIEQLVNWMKENGDTMKIAAGIIGGIMLVVLAAYTASMIGAAAATIAATWPILLVIAAIAAIAAAIWYAYNNIDFFRAYFDFAWDAIQKVIEFAWNNVIKPVFTALVSWIQNSLVPFLAVLWEKAQAVWSAIANVVSWAWNKVIQPAWTAISWYISNILVPYYTFLWNVVKTVFEAIANVVSWAWNNVIQPAWTAISWYISNILVPWFSFLWSVISKVFGYIAEKIVRVWTDIIQPIWNLLVSYITDVIVPILGILWDVVKTVWEAISAAISWAWNNVVRPTFDLIAGGVGMVIDVFGTVKDGIATAFSGVFDIIYTPFKTAFNFIADAWNNTVGKLSFTVPKWVPVFGGDKFEMPKIPKLHQGGIFQASVSGGEGLALLRDGEMVLTQQQQAALLSSGAGSGDTYNVVINTVAGDPAAIERVVVDAIGRANKRGMTALVP